MASKYIQKFPVPEGFPEILHDLAKEILRNQPADIIDFSAYYFKCLQEGLVLDYKKKGKNIPCDYKPQVPKKISKDQLEANKKQITRHDEENHRKAIENSKKLNHMHDAARTNIEEAAKRNPVVENDNNQISDEENPEHMENQELDSSELKNISSNFIEDVMTKKLKDYHGIILLKYRKCSYTQNQRGKSRY